MPINAIKFNIQDGGLGRALPGKDYYSGLAFPVGNTDLPAGFATDNRTVQIFTVQQAEALGITSDSTVDLIKIAHYHISEYFRMLNQSGNTGTLFVHLFDNSGTYDGADQVKALQDFAKGEIRQIGVYYDIPFASSLVSAVSGAVSELLTNERPTIAIIAADISGITDLTTLPDVRALDQKWVGVDISQDGSGTGKELFDSVAKSITGIGTLIGTIALSNVHENIGWVGKFDIADVFEYQEPSYSNGQLFNEISPTVVNLLSERGYITVVKRQETTGAFYLDSPLAVPLDSDFAYIENARTMFKAVRLSRLELLPFINSPIYVDASTGELTEDTIFQYENAVLKALEQMAVNGEINVNQQTGQLPKGSVLIDPNQNVLSTSRVEITIKIVPVGVAREIIVNIGFVPKIA